MPRLLILSGIALLALLAWLLLVPAADPGATRDGPSSDLLDPQAEDDWLPGGRGLGRSPGLRGGTAGTAYGTSAGGRAGRGHPDGPTGPYRFSVLSLETELPVAAVEIRTREGKLIGVTDVDGILQIGDVGLSGFSFRAVKEGFVAWLGRAEPGQPLEIQLAPGIPVEGHVLRFSDRTPLAGAGVRVFDEDLGREIASFSTKPSGHFRIQGVRPNHPFLLVISATGFAPHVQRLNLDVSVDDLEVLVGAGGVLTGRVLDAEGEAKADVEIRLVRENGPLLEHVFTGRSWSRSEANLQRARTGATRSDKNGRYRLRGVEVGKALQPVAVVGPRLEARGKVVRFKEVDQRLSRDIRIPHAASLRIVTQDGNGEAIGHAEIDVRTPLGRWAILPRDVRQGGSLTLENLTPGLCDVLARLPGAPLQTRRLRLKPGVRSEVRLVFPLGHALSGQVLSKRGKPIAKALVSWRGANGKERAEVRTSEEGAFRLSRLTQDLGTLIVSARDLMHAGMGYETRHLSDVPVASTPLKIVLKDGTRILGRFRDLSDRAVVRCDMFPGTAEDRTMLTLDEAARFRRGAARVGRTASFVFHLNGFPPLLHDEKEPFKSEEIRDLGPLFFEASNPRKGRVIGEKGAPLRGVKVSIDEAWSSRVLRTDRDGEFDFTRLPKRNVQLKVEADGYPANYAVLGTGSEFLRQTIKIGRTGTLAVRVLDAGGRPVRGARIEILELGEVPPDAKPVKLRTQAGAGGEMSMPLKVGKYRITAIQDTTRAIGQETFTIKAAHTETLTIRLAPAK